MFEWITRDPLNGIVITITFFISMIVGRYLRKKNEFLLDARIKIIIAFFIIISVTLMKHWYFPLLIFLLCIGISIKLRQFKNYTKKLVFPFILGVFVFGVQAFTYKEIEYGILIFSRMIASASILIILVITTSEHELLESLRAFRLPNTFIEIAFFMSRYIKIFFNESKKLTFAQNSRSGKAQIHNIASIFGLLIIRANEKSDEVYKAMVSRLWNPDTQYITEFQPINKKELIVGTLIMFSIIGFLIFDKII